MQDCIPTGASCACNELPVCGSKGPVEAPRDRAAHSLAVQESALRRRVEQVALGRRPRRSSRPRASEVDAEAEDEAPPPAAGLLRKCFSSHQLLLAAESMREVTTERAEPPVVAPAVNVPVYSTLLVKRIVEGGGDAIRLECTMIQRTLFADPLLVREAAETAAEAGPAAGRMGFAMRVNDSIDKDVLMHVRKTVRGGVTSAGGATFCAVTASAVLPLVCIPILDCQPFGIRALELTVEYSSFVAEVPGGANYTFRPDLLCHVGDLRNLVCVKNWDAKRRESVDQMKSWDLINTSPTMEVFFEAKRDRRTGACESVYCPRLRLTWFVKKDWIEAFVSMFLPILFVAIASALNPIYCLPKLDSHLADFVDDDWAKGNPEDERIMASTFFANQLTLALTLIFILPHLRSSGSLTNVTTSNDVFVFCLYLGLFLGVFGGLHHDHYAAIRLGNLLLVGSLGVPIRHLLKYKSVVRRIKRASRHGASPATFNGRPGKSKTSAAAGVDIGDLAHFYTVDDKRQVAAPATLFRGGAEGAWRPSIGKSGDVDGVYRGIRTRDIRAGLVRRLLLAAQEVDHVV